MRGVGERNRKVRERESEEDEGVKVREKEEKAGGGPEVCGREQRKH